VSPLRAKYFIEHIVFEHLQFVFHSQSKRSCITFTRATGKYFISRCEISGIHGDEDSNRGLVDRDAV